MGKYFSERKGSVLIMNFLDYFIIEYIWRDNNIILKKIEIRKN
jgi:hypothetical protein